jgi:hypothetical protein
MDQFINNLKTQAEQNPVLALAVGAGLITAISKFMNATSDSRNSRAWAKEVSRRAMKDSLKK